MANKTVYLNFGEVNELQTNIMKFVDVWAHENKTPIPLKLIIETMHKAGVIPATTIKALNSLLRKGYIRRAVTISNKTYFVQLRRV